MQHSLPAMLTLAAEGIFTVEQVIERMCHAPARLFRVRERGFLRPGYYADIAVVKLNEPWTVSRDNQRPGEQILSKCGWSPLEGLTLSAKVVATWVNGAEVYTAERGVDTAVRGKRLLFG